jgi:hypothetical protein
MLKECVTEVLSQCFEKCEGLRFAGLSYALRDGRIIDRIGELVAFEGGLIGTSQGEIDQNRLRL